MKVTKQTLGIILLILWSIFSAAYIVWNTWNQFKNGQIVQAYNAGKADAINEAMKQAQNEKCEPFSIWSGNNQVQLINVACLKQVGDATDTPPPSNKK